MKKLFTLIIFALLIFTLSACETTEAKSTSQLQTVVQTQEETKSIAKLETTTRELKKTKEPEVINEIKVDQIEEVEEIEENTLPDINNFWNRDNNYLDLYSYLYACGATNIEVSEFRGELDEMIVDINGYKIFIAVVNNSSVPNLSFGKSDEEIIAYYNFNREEHQILMTIIEENTPILVHTETLELLPELIRALKADEVTNLNNYIYI